MNNPTKDGFIFKGWYKTSDFSGESITKIEPGILEDINLYAKWEEIDKTYYVNYNYNGGTPVYNYKDQIVTLFLQDLSTYVGKTITKDTFMNDTYGVRDKVSEFFFKEGPYKTKWSWLFGYLVDISNKQEYSQVDVLLDNQNVNHYSVLRAVLYSFVTDTIYGSWPYGPDCATQDAIDLMWRHLEGPTSFKDNTELTLITPIRSGYRFAGWYQDPTFRGTPITKVTKGTRQDLDLYAKWVKDGEDETFIIDYIVDGGILTNHKVSFTVKDLPYTIPSITQEGAKFLGWYQDSNFTTSITQMTNTGNKVVYAKWEIIDPNHEYTITYNLNSGSLCNPKTEYKLGDLPLNLQVPTRTGYIFADGIQQVTLVVIKL